MVRSDVRLGFPHQVALPSDLRGGIYQFHYGKERSHQTSVYRLDLDTWKIEKVEPTGESPGWIYGHRAMLVSATEIHVRGGTVVKTAEGKDVHSENALENILDLGSMQWRRS